MLTDSALRKTDTPDGPAKYLNPLDAALMDLKAPLSGLQFPPPGWRVMREWGDNGYALQDLTGLRLIVDCSRKEDGKFWLHVSVSRAKSTPSHDDMARVKRGFIGNDRYAYSVWPPQENYVNIHEHCLHLWTCVEGNGQILPEFSADLDGVRSI